jgi:hypothetical protein
VQPLTLLPINVLPLGVLVLVSDRFSGIYETRCH